MNLRTAVSLKHPHVVAAMQEAGRPRPETSTMAFILFDKENKAMQEFCNLLPQHGFSLVAPVFDAALAVPQRRTQDDGEDAESREVALLKDFESKTGILMQVKPLSRPTPVVAVCKLLEECVSQGLAVHMNPVEHIPGRFACIGTALLNLFPDEGDCLRAATSNLTQPISYQYAMELCPSIAIEPCSFQDATQSRDGACFLVHAPNTWDADVGHAYGVKLAQASAQIYSSTQQEYIQTNAQLFWQKLSKIPGAHVFKVSLLRDAEPAAKRRKKEATSVELLLKAGVAEAEEILHPVLPLVRECMEKEVSAEIARCVLSLSNHAQPNEFQALPLRETCVYTPKQAFVHNMHIHFCFQVCKKKQGKRTQRPTLLAGCALSGHSAEGHLSSRTSRNTTQKPRTLSPTSRSSTLLAPSLNRSRRG